MAKLYFRYGAMNSSKTANALMVKFNYEERQQRVLLMKPALDVRDGIGMVKSRAGLASSCLLVERDGSVMDVLLRHLGSEPLHCLIVDEAQFLTKSQVMELTRIVDDLKIPVICYGLRADFIGNLFEGSQWLLSFADTIEEVKTICWCGRKAIMNARLLDGRVIKEGEQIVLGGNDRYISLCRHHWSTGETGPACLDGIPARNDPSGETGPACLDGIPARNDPSGEAGPACMQSDAERNRSPEMI